MSRIQKGDLVRFRSPNGPWRDLWNKTGIVVSKPKEKPFRMTPGIVSLEIVVDVLVEDQLYENVRVKSLEKKIIL